MYNDCNLCKGFDELEFKINDIGDWSYRGSSYLYGLLLEDEKYYIGYTKNLTKRLWVHFLGKGSKWTKRYPPVAIVFSKRYNKDKEYLLEVENFLTIFYMIRYGRDNVRGGKWTSRYPLSESYHRSIDKYEKRLTRISRTV